MKRVFRRSGEMRRDKRRFWHNRKVKAVTIYLVILVTVLLISSLLAGCKETAPPKIAFVYSEIDKQADMWDMEYDYEIYVMDTDGTNLRKLTSNYPDDDLYILVSRLAWSPDGRSIIYTSYDDGVLGISAINAESGNCTILTSGLTFYSAPTWSPDGRKIAFSASSTGREGVYVMDAADISHFNSQ